MSSTAAAAAVAAAVERQTYWCHECDMSVSLLSSSSASSSSSSLLCPHCHSDFLEQMDSPLFNPNPSLSFLDSPFPLLSPHQTTPNDAEFASDSAFEFPSAAADDNYLLDSPYLHRLIQHLTNSESDPLSPSPAAGAGRHHSPASKSAVASLPTVKITASFLDLDPIVLCAVCKDQFVIDVEAKQLPCNHMYHSDCILPWLSQHNSCPVCRFQLPVETDDGDSKRSSRFGSTAAVVVEEEDLFGFESTLRHIARRHRVVFPDWREGNVEYESLLSPTQVGEEAEIGVVERANSVETVSSWPSWVIEGGHGVDGGGDGDIGASDRVNDNDGDTDIYSS